MTIDKKLLRKTFESSAKETVQLFKSMESVFGRVFLYRILFEYPKKWSKRKVKKRGKKDIQYLKLEYGLHHFAKEASKLGPEYAKLFTGKE